MNKIILNIGGMSCAGCQARLEKYLNKQDGIKEAVVNLVLAQAQITYDDTLNILDIERFIKEAGYKSLGIYNPKIEKKEEKSFFSLVVFSVLALLVLYIAMAGMVGLPSISFLDMEKYPLNYTISLLVLTIIFLFYGRDILKQGIKNIIHGNPNMDSLVTLGVFTSFIYSFYNMVLVIKGNTSLVHHLYFESCAIIIYFIKLGRFIDKQSKNKTKAALEELVQITPSKALLKEDDWEREIGIDEVKKNDILICKTGMKIAVDGVVTSGKCYIDESFITGESKPVKKENGDKVLAGSINLEGYILYEAESIGPDSTISSIVRLVVEATNTKPKIQKLADTISAYFVPGIIIIAILTLLIYVVGGLGNPIIPFVSVLVVACPCALGLATPLAVVISEGLSAKKGILIKNSAVFETAPLIDTVIFDKTGTLTYGELKLAKLNNYSDLKREEILQYIGSLENKSTHPLARSLVKLVNEEHIPLEEVEDFKEIPGVGIRGKIHKKTIYLGNNKLFKELKIKNNYLEDEEELAKDGASIIYFIRDKKVMALLGMQDIPRENSEKTIKELKRLGKDVMMLTGDNELTGKAIAKEVGINKVIASVSPSAKNKIVKDLLKEGHQVMMVGDGINDAVCLTSATIGVSLSSGTDIAGNSAEVILIHNDLEDLIKLFKISKKTIKIIKQNLFWAFFYNLLMIPLATGLLPIKINPMLASLAMVCSSVTVVLNSLRLRRE